MTCVQWIIMIYLVCVFFFSSKQYFILFCSKFPIMLEKGHQCWGWIRFETVLEISVIQSKIEFGNVRTQFQYTFSVRGWRQIILNYNIDLLFIQMGQEYRTSIARQNLLICTIWDCCKNSNNNNYINWNETHTTDTFFTLIRTLGASILSVVDLRSTLRLFRRICLPTINRTIFSIKIRKTSEIFRNRWKNYRNTMQ